MDFDALLLSRLQFAFTIAFHIIFPAFTIGLASFLAVCEGLWLITKRAVFKDLYLHWVKIFALAFGMGVVSGVVMSYQFGTNWSVFADMTAPVLGPLLGYEVLTAFFLEASFLGIMLFGWNRVGPKLHFIATAAVAVGTLISAFWILSANSWMQTPAGYAVMEDGRFTATSWMEVIFNPSFPSRFVHMILAAYLTTAMVVLAAGAWQVLKKRPNPASKTQMRMAAGLIAILMPIQIWAGHWSGEVAHHYQPAKVAAMEGWWETQSCQPTHLFGIPDQDAETNHFEVSVPCLGSIVVAGDKEARLEGLKEFSAENRPPVFMVFWSFRIMVGAGLIMLLIGWWGSALWGLRRLDRPGLFHWLAVPSGVLGFVAVLTGWITAEVGRQPYTVYGVLRTEDSVSPVDAGQVATSLLVFLVVYGIVFTAGAVYMMRIMAKGPNETKPPKADRAPGSPLAAVDDMAEPEGGAS